MVWHPLYTFTDGEAVADTTVYGFVPGKRNAKRKILLTIQGNRYTVPEDEIEFWLAKQEAALAQEALEKPAKVVRKGKKQAVIVKQPTAPKIVISTEDAWLRNIVADANRRVQERLQTLRAMQIAQAKAAEDDADEETILLMIL